MKSNLKFILFSLVIGLFMSSSSAIAQSNPDLLLLSSDTGITLMAEGPNGESYDLAETYDIDFSNRVWSIIDAQNAEKYFEEKSHLIDLELDYNNKKFILKLDLNAPGTANWDVYQWNHHLANVR